MEREENIAKQRKPLNNEIFAKNIRMAKKAGRNSLEVVVANTEAVGKFLGWRLSEYSQPKQDSVDYHVYRSGKKGNESRER